MPSRSKQSEKSNHYGPPLSTPKPGGTTRKRPKPGDKDPDYKKPAKKKRAPSKPTTKKPSKPSYNKRDYRGVDGAVDDANKGKKK